MVNSNSVSDDGDGIDCGVNRRTVLQGLGTGAVAGTSLVGSASAHSVSGKPVFCGCSQICVCVDGNSGVLMARETDDGEFEVGFVVGPDELDPYPDGPPRYSGNFCVSTDDEEVPDGKIIGLQVAGTRWVNPNQCARTALDAEQEQLASTHPRPVGDSGGPCGKPPCEHPGRGNGDDADAGKINATWQDCGTVKVTGPDEGLEEIVVHPIRCFPGEGPCPDGVPGGRSIEDPDLPLTIDDRHLAVDGDEVPYRIVAIELRGDVEQDVFELPDDLDCSFGPSAAIDVTYEDCETATLEGPDEDLDKVDFHLIRCFDDDTSHKTDLDGSTGCPTGHIVTREAPDLPLTLGREGLALGDEQYFIDEVDLFGVDGPHSGSVEPPEDFDCNFDPIHQGLNIEFEMDDRTITLAEGEDAVSQVTVTGTAEFGFAGWEELGHAFITVWAGQASGIDFGDDNDDRERYFDLDQPAVVRNQVEITLDVPPAVGDPEPGEVIETEIIGEGFFGLEKGTDPQESENIGDWRENDPMTLRVERRGEGDFTGQIEATWEDCETVQVTGSDDGLDEIIVHPLRCFPDGPCPDGVPGGRTIEEPDLPLRIDDQQLGYDGDEVPYTIVAIELRGDVEQDSFGKPDDLDCHFIDVTFEDCETVTLEGPGDDPDKILLTLEQCFDDPNLGCPSGKTVTLENPQLPLTLGRDELADGDEEYRIENVNLFGDVRPESAQLPDSLDCSFE